jgi:hypothetical protein
MNKRVLLICKHFAPENSIAAIRLTKLGKYISKRGYIVDVLVTQKYTGLEDPILVKDLVYFRNVYILDTFKIINSIIQKKAQKNLTKESANLNQKVSIYKLFVLKHLNYLFWLINELSILTVFKRNKSSFLEYDIVISSYGPHSSHLIGNNIKKKNKRIIWVADFRDPVYQLSVPIIFRNYAKKFINKNCKNADFITSASNEQIKDLYLKNFKGKVLTVSNGYDLEDLSNYEDFEKDTKACLNFAYLGTIYSGKQDLTPLFKAIRIIIDRNAISQKRIRFHYAGNDFGILFSQAKTEGLEDILVDNGFVNREESLKIQARSDVLVVSAWKNEIENMSLAGKLFEYLLFNKPILGIVSGSVKFSEMKNIINKINHGFVYEEANHKIDIILLIDYIIFLINLKYSKKDFKLYVDHKAKLFYDYRNITNNLLRDIGM